MSESHLPQNLHFVGIGGIGMNGLAQAAASLGCRVTGSDRALDKAENRRIFDSLERQGVRLFPQDGSVYKTESPDALVVSSAIEQNNPDFVMAPASIPHLHRSVALALSVAAMSDKKLRAVAGSSGKTTVTAWLTEALVNLGRDPGSLCGGLMNRFVSERYCGTFRPGSGHDFVIEADESDRSLLNYSPDSAIILNIGTDHYSRKELADVFRRFVLSLRSHAVIEDRAFLEIGPDTLKNVELTLFSADPDAPSVIAGRRVRKLNSYQIEDGKVRCSFDGRRVLTLPAPGLHNALNALAVYSELCELDCDPDAAADAVEQFSGVWRRFDFAGFTPHGAAVYDDYAHNVEKITSVIQGAQALAPSGRVVTAFQPHGFAPLRFMREDLFRSLEQSLRRQDVFALLPVFYAGGTTSFSPTSEEVLSDYLTRSDNPDRWLYCPDRNAVEKLLPNLCGPGDILLILGARDNSLSIWAKKIAQKT